MKINFNFEVIARCKVYNDIESEPIDTEDITLTFDLEKAGLFLFKFGSNSLMLDNDYGARFKYDNNGNLSGLILTRRVMDGANNYYTYICTNLKQVINDVHEGYIRLQMLDRFTDIMEFDFKAGIELQNQVEDEFE